VVLRMTGSIAKMRCGHPSGLTDVGNRRETSQLVLYASLLLLRARRRCYCVTVNIDTVVAVPAGVLRPIAPESAPMGTIAVTCESEFTINFVAFTPPKVTLVVCVAYFPCATPK